MYICVLHTTIPRVKFEMYQILKEQSLRVFRWKLHMATLACIQGNLKTSFFIYNRWKHSPRHIFINVYLQKQSSTLCKLSSLLSSSYTTNYFSILYSTFVRFYCVNLQGDISSDNDQISHVYCKDTVFEKPQRNVWFYSTGAIWRNLWPQMHANFSRFYRNSHVMMRKSLNYSHWNSFWLEPEYF